MTTLLRQDAADSARETSICTCKQLYTFSNGITIERQASASSWAFEKYKKE